MYKSAQPTAKKVKVRFFWSEELKFGTDVAQGVLNKDPDRQVWADGTSLSNSRWRPAAILFIPGMRFWSFTTLRLKFFI